MKYIQKVWSCKHCSISLACSNKMLRKTAEPFWKHLSKVNETIQREMYISMVTNPVNHLAACRPSAPVQWTDLCQILFPQNCEHERRSIARALLIRFCGDFFSLKKRRFAILSAAGPIFDWPRAISLTHSIRLLGPMAFIFAHTAAHVFAGPRWPCAAARIEIYTPNRPQFAHLIETNRLWSWETDTGAADTFLLCTMFWRFCVVCNLLLCAPKL